MSSAKHPQSKQLVRDFLMNYQNKLTDNLEQLDGQAQFIEDRWQRDHLGGGITRIITDGKLFEQGGVNFSEVSGTQLPPSILAQRPNLENETFWAAGVSLVLHPHSPYCPTVHLNYRYFEAGETWWFGGGSDLTPYYPFIEDCQHWHQTLKTTMDRHDPNYYLAYKYWCDEYFFNHHRNETRGVGGTFYDYQDGQAGILVKADNARKSEQSTNPALQLKQTNKTWSEIFAFHQDNANAFLPSYIPIIEKRRNKTWTEQERQFQLYRRGRYVEFNLLYDRGTLFGLQSKGRTESILMSLPPLVRWAYRFTPAAHSPEAQLTEQFLNRHIDWLAEHPVKNHRPDGQTHAVS